MRVRLTTSVADRTLDFLLLFQFFPSGLPLRRQQHTYHLFHFPASFPMIFESGILVNSSSGTRNIFAYLLKILSSLRQEGL
jgi:hypothetical protein